MGYQLSIDIMVCGKYYVPNCPFIKQIGFDNPDMSHMSHVSACFHMSQVSGQALVDLLNHAKENGSLFGSNGMGWKSKQKKAGKGGKK